jgi:hypothetical protein
MPASFALTSSIDFEPKLRMSRRSASEAAYEFAHGVDALAFEAVVGADGEFEFLDREREVGGAGAVRLGGADVDAFGVDVELAGEPEELDQTAIRSWLRPDEMS